MNYGFFRVVAASPSLKVADCTFNANEIIALVHKAETLGGALIVFPELCITGYTCEDLFFQTTLLQSALNETERIAKETASLKILIAVGLPLQKDGTLYNCCAVLFKGKIIAFIPKSFIPNYSEFYERRHFAPGNNLNANETIFISKKNPRVPFGTNILISAEENSNITIGFEICEDLWVTVPPSTRHATNGATIIANLSASNEVIGKVDYRRLLVQSHSARIIASYIYADAGHDESSQDMVFSSHNIIAENGTILKESTLFSGEMIFSDIDTERLLQERQKTTTFFDCKSSEIYTKITLPLFIADYDKNFDFFRPLEKKPFVPENLEKRTERCKAVISLQAEGLAKRLRHIGTKNAVIGLSGGLDSTLALLVTLHAFDLCGLDKNGILCITMPCFGTTDRTYNNACALAKESGTTLKEIKITDSVLSHFKDIEQNQDEHDTTYENAQARERTQVLMDMANKTGGIVIGTGDLSELALGWATYNGDHMSMYGVNSSIPKTLVRHLVQFEADTNKNQKLKNVLYDILNTPVSPELLPPTNGNIAQKTEEIVGPYELHDFFLYYLLRFGFSPTKIYFLAKKAFLKSEWTPLIIKKWLRVFYKRFFSQQFKRSCLPDGAKVGTVSLSPRGDWRMPSDASVELWLHEIDSIDLE